MNNTISFKNQSNDEPRRTTSERFLIRYGGSHVPLDTLQSLVLFPQYPVGASKSRSALSSIDSLVHNRRAFLLEKFRNGKMQKKLAHVSKSSSDLLDSRVTGAIRRPGRALTSLAFSMRTPGKRRPVFPPRATY